MTDIYHPNYENEPDTRLEEDDLDHERNWDHKDHHLSLDRALALEDREHGLNLRRAA